MLKLFSKALGLNPGTNAPIGDSGCSGSITYKYKCGMTKCNTSWNKELWGYDSNGSVCYFSSMSGCCV